MGRLDDVINEDREMLSEGRIKEWQQVVTLKLSQISTTLAMIYDLEKTRRYADDGR